VAFLRSQQLLNGGFDDGCVDSPVGNCPNGTPEENSEVNSEVLQALKAAHP
jgi:hypothetical protein